MKTQFRGALVALLLFTLLAVGVAASGPLLTLSAPLYGTSNFDAIVTDSTIVAGTSIASGTAINAGTSVSAATSVTAGTFGKSTTYMQVGTFLEPKQATTVAVGAGATITPLGTNQPITSTAGVTTSTSTAIANGATAGDIVILRNANASDTITVDGTGGNVECKTDKVLGAQDTLMLMWNGSDWVCIGGHSDNS